MKLPFWIKALVRYWKKKDTEQKSAYQVSFTCPICNKEHLLPHVVETILRKHVTFYIPIKCPNNTKNSDIMFAEYSLYEEGKLKVAGPFPLAIALDLK